jgi:hypothetical protein
MAGLSFSRCIRLSRGQVRDQHDQDGMPPIGKISDIISWKGCQALLDEIQVKADVTIEAVDTISDHI